MSIENLIKNKLLNNKDTSENILSSLKTKLNQFNNSALDLLHIEVKSDIIEVTPFSLFLSKTNDNFFSSELKIEIQKNNGKLIEISEEKAINFLMESIEEQSSPYDWINTYKEKLDIKAEDGIFLIKKNKLKLFLSPKKIKAKA